MPVTNIEQFEYNRTGGRIITSADGAITGNFGRLIAITQCTLTNITLSGTWANADSETRLEAATIPAGADLLVTFTGITVATGTVMVVNQ